MESPNLDSTEVPSTDISQEELVIPTQTHSTKIGGGKIKQIFNSALAAAAMFSSMPSDKATAAEPQVPQNGLPSIEDNSASSIEVEGHAAVKEWLKEFGNPDLLIGKPKSRVRSPIEQVGIYHGGQHIGDILKPGMPPHVTFNLTKEEFDSRLKGILDAHKIPYSETLTFGTEGETHELTIGPGVEQKVTELGMTLQHVTEQLPDGKTKNIVALSANVHNPDASKALMFKIDKDSDGKKDTYAKIYVSSEGILTLEGKDGETFRIQFVKDENGVIITKEIK